MDGFSAMAPVDLYFMVLVVGSLISAYAPGTMVRLAQFRFSLPRMIAAGLSVLDTPFFPGKSFKHSMVYSTSDDNNSFVILLYGMELV